MSIFKCLYCTTDFFFFFPKWCNVMRIIHSTARFLNVFTDRGNVNCLCLKWLRFDWFRLALLCLRCLWCWILFPPSSSSSHSPNLPNNCAIYLGEDLLFLFLVLRVHRDVVLLPLTVPELDLDAASLPASCPLLLFRPHFSISPSSLSEIRQLSREFTTKYREACTLVFILLSFLKEYVCCILFIQ